MSIYKNGNPNASDITQYLEGKKALAKMEIDYIKEKMDLNKSREFLEGDRPTKCFFQKLRKHDLKPLNISGFRGEGGNIKKGLAEMLDIATNFFKNLYTADEIDDNMVNFFLEHVEPIVNNQFLHDDLCKEFSLEELWDAIVSFVNGKSPGPDGISIEFYKAMYSVIKDDLLCVFNSMLDQESIPIKLKNGLIVLIPKGDPTPEIENYRGITLNNVDLKFFSKMLHFRLAPYLKDYIHPSQFSAPGRREWELNNLIRDIYQEMEAETIYDSFMIRIDFAKAFDSIDMGFLYKVMEKMGIPRKFIALVKAMDSDVTAKQCSK